MHILCKRMLRCRFLPSLSVLFFCKPFSKFPFFKNFINFFLTILLCAIFPIFWPFFPFCTRYLFTFSHINQVKTLQEQITIQDVPLVNVIGGLQSCSLNSIKLNNIPLPAAEDYSNELKYGKTETKTRDNLFIAPKRGKTPPQLMCWFGLLVPQTFHFLFANSLLPPLLPTLLSTRVLVICCNITGTEKVAMEF